MNNNLIEPTFQSLYYWHFSQSEDQSRIILNFRFPKEFNPKVINIHLSDDGKSLEISAPNIIPFVQGELFDKITSYEEKIDNINQTIEIVLSPENSNVLWPRLINSYLPGTTQIDPHSAFEIYIQETTKEADFEQSHTPFTHEYTTEQLEAFFASSITCCYIPALLFMIESLDDDDKDSLTTKEAFLNIAATKYHNPEATFRYSLFLIQHGKKIEGFKLLKDSAELGIGMAVSIMGQMISPLSGIEFEYKNAEEALDLFEKVLVNNEEPVALYEAAKLYQAGIGCEKNIQKAQEYWRRAKAVEPNILDLPEIKTQKSSTALVVSIAIAGAAAFGYGIYRILRGKSSK